MSLYSILFYVFSLTLIGSALYAVLTQQIIRAVFALFITFFSVAGIFVFANADFLAITQLVVYVGGILVLLLFGIMLSDRTLFSLNYPSKKLTTVRLNSLIPFSVVALLFVVFYFVLSSDLISHIDWIKKSNLAVTRNTAEQIGVQLMTKYLLPFEAISIILLVALIGAAFIARKIE